jgi:hypothetical protein
LEGQKGDIFVDICIRIKSLNTSKLGWFINVDPYPYVVPQNSTLSMMFQVKGAMRG